MQRLLYRARTGVKLGATTSPDGEEARALFLAWDEMGPLLAYAPEDPESQAVVAMRDLLRDLYNDMGGGGAATQGRPQRCKLQRLALPPLLAANKGYPVLQAHLVVAGAKLDPPGVGQHV